MPSSDCTDAQTDMLVCCSQTTEEAHIVSYNVASGSVITPCIKIDKGPMVYIYKVTI